MISLRKYFGRSYEPSCLLCSHFEDALVTSTVHATSGILPNPRTFHEDFLWFCLQLSVRIFWRLLTHPERCCFKGGRLTQQKNNSSYSNLMKVEWNVSGLAVPKLRSCPEWGREESKWLTLAGMAIEQNFRVKFVKNTSLSNCEISIQNDITRNKEWNIDHSNYFLFCKMIL